MKKKLLPKHHSQLSCCHYDLRLAAAKHNSIPRAPAAARNPWRNHSTALCRDWVAKHNRIATRYCRTHRCDAPVPTHKVSQHMQSTIAQQQQRREKVTWNPQFHCARISSKIPRQSDRRATEPSFTRKNNVSCKSWHSKSIHDVADPMRSAQNDLQNTIQSQDTTGDQGPFWVSENVTSWSLKVHANWTQWSGLVWMWLHDLLRHTPSGHNDLGATGNKTIRNSEFPPWNFLWWVIYHSNCPAKTGYPIQQPTWNRPLESTDGSSYSPWFFPHPLVKR